MKTKERAKLSLETNEIILKSLLIKMAELNVEISRINYKVEDIKDEIQKNKEILNGLSISEIKEFGQNILDRIFNPELDIRLGTDWDDGDDEESAKITILEIYQGGGSPALAYERTHSNPSKEHIQEIIYTMIVEDVIRDLIRMD